MRQNVAVSGLGGWLAHVLWRLCASWDGNLKLKLNGVSLWGLCGCGRKPAEIAVATAEVKVTKKSPMLLRFFIASNALLEFSRGQRFQVIHAFRGSHSHAVSRSPCAWVAACFRDVFNIHVLKIWVTQAMTIQPKHFLTCWSANVRKPFQQLSSSDLWLQGHMSETLGSQPASRVAASDSIVLML